MFSMRITLSRRLSRRRALYPWLVAGSLTGASIGLGYALPISQINGRWLYEAPWRQLTLWAGSILCLLAALGAIVVHRWRTMVLGQDNLQCIRWLSPREFNHLVEEGFRGQGYFVQPSERFLSRAGIDLILRKGENHILVLCRRDADPARQMAAVQELYTATATLQGGSGLLITCERVAPDVKAFAAGQGIAVIEGPALLKLVERASGKVTRPAPAVRREPSFGTPLMAIRACASCGGPMVPASRDEQADPEHGTWHCGHGEGCYTPRLA
jgi:restriction system protein